MADDRQLPELTVYTDGACSPNPGPGGWGAVILADGKVVRELSGYGGESTNNRMELTAAVAALKSIEGRHRIVLYTDSNYLRHGITDWIVKWQRNGWQTADRRPVKNCDLWQELLVQIEQHRITWKWVRGHGTDRWNNRADELAVLARKSGVEPERHDSPTIRQSAADGVCLYLGVTCRQSVGIGGWAVILTWRNRVRVLGGRAEGMTANQLYIHAAIEGLTALKTNLPVHLFTYSGYLRDGAVSWLPGWRQRDWLTREGAPVSNRELWQRLAGLLDQHQVQIQLADRQQELCAMQEAKELAREFEQGAAV
ncbi:MAG: ribonuclease HI [Desulfofustis sp.]|jgi:ribonuclease HI|nr:ribonuclease HI [Desulfofustis sp.]